MCSCQIPKNPAGLGYLPPNPANPVRFAADNSRFHRPGATRITAAPAALTALAATPVGAGRRTVPAGPEIEPREHTMSRPVNPIVVIPARMASTRLPGKPLAEIAGAPMIVQVWRRAVEAAVGPVLVAVAEPEVAEAVRRAGGRAILTRPDHPSGSDRVFVAGAANRRRTRTGRCLHRRRRHGARAEDGQAALALRFQN